jgi:D-glycero-alpha-D-manno-heptose 1-phosphate guanylyltransferase
MTTEAIILAGGLGTRLRDSVPGLPKAMAPVGGKPFISFVIDALRMQGIQRLVFSLGYKSEIIEDYLSEYYPTLDYKTVVETSPLGTGGAIQVALNACTTPHVLIANGDTLYKINLPDLESVHLVNESVCTLALKPMKNFDRYGVVETDESNRIISFREKKFYDEGLINGGIYIVDKNKFLQHRFSGSFSFEKDFLEKFYRDGRFFGNVQNGYFIDIGIPEDFEKAGIDLQRPVFDIRRIGKDWTLFLDRDGVINDERVGEYVLHWKQFIFSKGVLEVFKKLSDVFGRIIIISNQRGVGKGLMKEEDLQSIHLEMQREVEIVKGKIDRIYYCTEKDDRYYFRKPNPGMAYQAVKDLPDIDLLKSVMVGNKPSDMRFGRYAGMFTVFVKTTNPGQVIPHPDIDMACGTLHEFASML